MSPKMNTQLHLTSAEVQRLPESHDILLDSNRNLRTVSNERQEEMDMNKLGRMKAKTVRDVYAQAGKVEQTITLAKAEGVRRDRRKKSESGRSGPAPSKHPNSSSDSQGRSSEMRTGSSRSGSGSGDIKCYRCGGRGHRKTECPSFRWKRTGGSSFYSPSGVGSNRDGFRGNSGTGDQSRFSSLQSQLTQRFQGQQNRTDSAATARRGAASQVSSGAAPNAPKTSGSLFAMDRP